MPTQTLPTRTQSRTSEKLAPNLVLALTLHGLILAALAGAAYLSHRTTPPWGDKDPLAGAIAASAVSALPLPPKQRFKENEVLASDRPSLAPTPTAASVAPKAKALPAPAKAEPPPKPNEILLPTKKPDAKPIKPSAQPADKPAPPSAKPTNKPPDNPASTRTPPTPPTPKATTGETSGIQIPQAISTLKHGTAAMTVEDRAFGDRYAYYIRLVAKKCDQSKDQDQDSPETRGKVTSIRFTIDADGNPTEIAVATPSGSPSLDTSTLRAIQRIDGFGPLPQGNHLAVVYRYTSR